MPVVTAFVTVRAGLPLSASAFPTGDFATGVASDGAVDVEELSLCDVGAGAKGLFPHAPNPVATTANPRLTRRILVSFMPAVEARHVPMPHIDASAAGGRWINGLRRY